MEENKKETILGGNSRISGNLFFQGPTEINSTIEGDIVGESLITIGEEAKLTSNVKSVKVVIYGNVQGNIVAKEKVLLKKTAVVTGNIDSPCVEIQEGAVFNGACTMGGKNAEDDASSFVKKEK